MHTRYLSWAGSTIVFLLPVAAAVVAAAQAPAGAAARTVWDGVYSEQQAGRGRIAFDAHCSSCHGADLSGAEAKPLKGDRFWTDWQETSVDYLLGQISRNMPFSEDGSLAGSLPANTYLDIVAHILQVNGFPAGPQDLTEGGARGVPIVRREGPGELPASAQAHVVGCLVRGASGWRLERASPPSRVLSGQQPDPRRPLGNREYTLMFVITRLDAYVGHRMSATGTLIGAGGTGGLEVSAINPVSERCD